MDPTPPHSGFEPDLPADILRGAKAIAAFLFGTDAREVRRVYYLAERDLLPVFRTGDIIHARKSTLLAWIADQEGGAGRDAA